MRLQSLLSVMCILAVCLLEAIGFVGDLLLLDSESLWDLWHDTANQRATRQHVFSVQHCSMPRFARKQLHFFFCCISTSGLLKLSSESYST